MNIVVIVITVHFCQGLNEYDGDGDHFNFCLGCLNMKVIVVTLHFCQGLNEYSGDCDYCTFLSRAA